MTARERIGRLRALLQEEGIDIYVVPTADYHGSEDVGAYFRAREYLTGFTGSAGTAVVSMDGAWLWTDGRYFLQAERQLDGSGITLMRQGEIGVPTIERFIEETLPEGGVIGLDGRTVSASEGRRLEAIARGRGGRLCAEHDLPGKIWLERPGLPTTPLWILEESYSGESTADKLGRIRAIMSKKGAALHLVSSLYDIAWILNLRGSDLPCTPVFLSYLLIEPRSATLFVRDEVISEEVRSYLADRGIAILPYDEVCHALAGITGTILLDEDVVNYSLRCAVPDTARVLSGHDPSYILKAVKNETEIAHTRQAHLTDGALVTKFIYYLKTHVGREEITEYSAAQYLDSLRASSEGYIDLSFDTISAYGPNAAMMHYSAPAVGSAVLKPRGFYLVDSGAHYLLGTTDITRTIALGPLSPTEKKHFTAVARAMLRLADAHFLYGASGVNLDILSRGILWDLHMDYRCGTGHGVGHILNVHEGPNGFRWKIVPERIDSAVLEPGMITSDEPGVYLEGEYGIRLENELLCVEDTVNEYGRFLSFEHLTYAPIDLDAIDPDELDSSDIERLNSYHAAVYEHLSPYLDDEEREWLARYTHPLPGRS